MLHGLRSTARCCVVVALLVACLLRLLVVVPLVGRLLCEPVLSLHSALVQLVVLYSLLELVLLYFLLMHRPTLHHPSLRRELPVC